MPNRIIKDSIRTSDTLNQLTDFQFRLWVGLLVSADDAGRGDARPAIIKGSVFPLRERVTIKDVSDALHGLAACGCISLYTVGGKSYYMFPTWAAHQRLDRAKPRYPGPEEADLPKNDDSRQLAADRGNLRQTAADCGLNTNTNPNTNTNTNTNTNPNPNTNPKTQKKEIDDIYNQNWRHSPRARAATAQILIDEFCEEKLACATILDLYTVIYHALSLGETPDDIREAARRLNAPGFAANYMSRPLPTIGG